MIPDFRIEFDANDATSTVRRYLSGITVRDQDGSELDTATVELAHSPQIVIPKRGAGLEISLGYKNQDVWPVFKGVINAIAIQGTPDKLFLKATGLALSDEKRLQGSETRSWNEKTLGEIASEIIEAAGFKARVHSRLSAIVLKRAMQNVQTDLEYLQALADHYGGFLKSDGETVALLPARSRESASGKELAKVTVQKTPDITEYGWTQEYRNFAGTIAAFYQDDGKTLKVEQGSGNPKKSLKHIYSSQAEAQAAVDEEVKRYETQSVFTATLPGRDIPVGSPLELKGFPDPVPGEFWVRSATHEYGSGYRVRIEADR